MSIDVFTNELITNDLITIDLITIELVTKELITNGLNTIGVVNNEQCRSKHQATLFGLKLKSTHSRIELYYRRL